MPECPRHAAANGPPVNNVSVPDVKPPRSTGDDRDVLTLSLQYLRESFVRKVTGVDEAAARQSPVASGTSLLWLIKHLAYAERVWIIHRFAGGERPALAVVTADDTVDGALSTYRDTWKIVDAVVASAPNMDELSGIPDDRGLVTLRWILVHLVEETARHAGHADILRELIDGISGR
jgi:uncharacterized damage-inducible protein DinB